MRIMPQTGMNADRGARNPLLAAKPKPAAHYAGVFATPGLAYGLRVSVVTIYKRPSSLMGANVKNEKFWDWKIALTAVAGVVTIAVLLESWCLVNLGVASCHDNPLGKTSAPLEVPMDSNLSRSARNIIEGKGCDCVTAMDGKIYMKPEDMLINCIDSLGDAISYKMKLIDDGNDVSITYGGPLSIKHEC